MAKGQLILRVDGVGFLAPLLKSKNLAIVAPAAKKGMQRLTGREIKREIIGQFDEHYYRGSKSRRKLFKGALKGKKIFLYKRKRILWAVPFGPSTSLQETYRFEFHAKNKLIGSLIFSQVTGEMALELSQQENAECHPFDRYAHFKQLSDLSARLVKPKQYSFDEGRIYTRKFELTFAKNSAAFDVGEVNNIKKYLSDSSLNIKSAQVLAYASIEGDSAKNAILHHQRAQVLWKALAAIGEKEFTKSVHTSERWAYFYNQLRKHKITAFEGLRKADIKALFRRDSVQVKYEYLLREQRQAILGLKMYKQYSLIEKITLLRKDILKLNEQVAELLKAKRSEQRQLKLSRLAMQLVSIELALDDFLRRGWITHAEGVEIFNMKVYSFHEWYMIRFYTMQRQWQKGLQPQFFNLEQILLQAHESARKNISGTLFNDSNIALRQTTDVQSMAYELIREGTLDPAFFYRLNYPDDPKYYHLILNRLNFKRLNEHLLPEVEADKNLSTIGDLNVTNSRYYFLLKKRVQGTSSKVLQMIQRSDNLYYWDLYEFLWFNIEGWNVGDNKLFDPEISVGAIDKYLGKLLAAPHDICPDDLYQLAINFPF